MINNDLLRDKIIDSAIRGELVKNDTTLESVDVTSIKENIPFDIPSNWKWCTLKSVAILKTGNSISDSDKVDKYSNMEIDGLYYVGTKDIITNLYINYENGIKIPSDCLGKFKIANENSSLICIEGGSAGRKVGFTTKEICFVNKLCNIYSEVINNRYIYYFLQTKFFVKEFDLKKTGIIGGVSLKNLEQLLIPVPPLEEQKRIVSSIDELYKLIGQKEQNDNEKNKLKKILKERILDSAIHGNLVKNDLTIEPVSSKYLIYEEPFVIPSNWLWSNFDKMATKISDGTHSTPKYIDEGIPFLSVKDMSDGQLHFDNCKYISKEEHDVLYKRCDPKRNDLLITKVGTTGVPVIVDTDDEFSIFVSVAQLRFNLDELDLKYIRYVVLSKFVQNIISENTRGAVNKNWVIKDIKKTTIPLPPLEEQKRIVEKIESLFELIEQL